MNPNDQILPWPALLAFLMVSQHLSIVLAQGVTFTTNTYTVGGNPTFVVAADVNSDNQPDLVAVKSPSALLVLTNDGSGSFGSNATLAVGLSPYGIAAADVNGDGKPDLISANTGYSYPNYGTTLTVLTNDGSGRLGSNAAPKVGRSPYCVVAGDLNGDGQPDLTSANFNDNTLTVLTNNGSGVFGSNATLSVGVNPNCVLAADVNGDGWLDLISNDNGAATLTVLTNNGSGVFGFNATLLGYPLSPVWTTAADVNGDGKSDLISANGYGQFANTLIVLTNNGSGGLGSNTVLSVGSTPQCVAAADVSGDGWLDLISANQGANTLTVLTNSVSGAFGFNATLKVGNGPYRLATADVNSDGRPDLISANLFGGTLTVLINTTVVPGPWLSIALAGSQIALLWPASATNYILESATNLSAPCWVAVTNGTPITGGVTLTNSLPAAFFRLHQFY